MEVRGLADSTKHLFIKKVPLASQLCVFGTLRVRGDECRPDNLYISIVNLPPIRNFPENMMLFILKIILAYEFIEGH